MVIINSFTQPVKRELVSIEYVPCIILQGINHPSSIEKEILGFYTGLMGSCAASLPMIDVPFMRMGPRLSSAAAAFLIHPVSTQEIDPNPGIDGFNGLFFRQTWHVIKDDVYVLAIQRKLGLKWTWSCNYSHSHIP